MILGSSRSGAADGASTGRAGLAVRIVDMTAAAGCGAWAWAWSRAARKNAAWRLRAFGGATPWEDGESGRSGRITLMPLWLTYTV